MNYVTYSGVLKFYIRKQLSVNGKKFMSFHEHKELEALLSRYALITEDS